MYRDFGNCNRKVAKSTITSLHLTFVLQTRKLLQKTSKQNLITLFILSDLPKFYHFNHDWPCHHVDNMEWMTQVISRNLYRTIDWSEIALEVDYK